MGASRPGPMRGTHIVAALRSLGMRQLGRDRRAAEGPRWGSITAPWDPDTRKLSFPDYSLQANYNYMLA